MKINPFKSSIALVSWVLMAQSSFAHGVKCNDIQVAHPYSTPTIGASKTGAVYFKSMNNTGKEVDQLIGARAHVSSSVEIHEMSLEQNIMKMRAIPEVQLPPGFEVSFKHGQANGFHLMLIDLHKPLKLGDKFPITLQFKRAGECQAEVWVENPKADAHRH